MTRHIGILGATFDPVHQGHLQPALSALAQLKLDEVWLMPNKAPYYKPQPKASDEQRLEMLNIVAQCNPGLKVCT